MNEGEPDSVRRTPAAIEQLQWANEQADKRTVRKIEALLNEFMKRVARFLGIHHKKGRPKPEFEVAERRLDLAYKAANNLANEGLRGMKAYASSVNVLHQNLVENYDKFAPPIRLSLDEPGPDEEATDIVSAEDEEVQEIYDRLGKGN